MNRMGVTALHGGAPGAATGAELSAALLGGCRVSLQDVVVDTASSRRTRTLLAYLLVHRRAPVPRDVLMDVFWPSVAPAAARNSLHVALSGLRQVLRAAWPGSVIERRYDTYTFAPEVRVHTDVDAFTAAVGTARRAGARGRRDAATQGLERACQLYAGDFLPTDPYLDWAGPVREQLRLDAVAAQRALMQIYLDKGDLGPAAVLGRSVLALDPADERAHRVLMTCYAASDQRHLALDQYQRMARVLWRGFGVGPSAESTALYERLRGTVASRSVLRHERTS